MSKREREQIKVVRDNNRNNNNNSNNNEKKKKGTANGRKRASTTNSLVRIHTFAMKIFNSGNLFMN